MDNTKRVVHATCGTTVRSVTGVGLLSHNLCMANDPIAVDSGARIRRCRSIANWTQRQLATETGWSPDLPDGEQPDALSPSRIANFEQGTRRVRHEEARILERVFHIPAAYFLAAIDQKESDVIAALRGLPGRTPPLDPTGT
jgi:transcriptional regulator with XRE-family HTH domain